MKLSSADSRRLKDLRRLKAHIREAPAHVCSNSFVSAVLQFQLDNEITKLLGREVIPDKSQSQNGHYWNTASGRYEMDQNIPIQGTIATERRRKTAKSLIWKKQKPKTFLDKVLSCLRLFFLDAPLFLLFLLVVLSTILQSYYTGYIMPYIDAANWADDDAIRLRDEFTYYARECDERDVTTSSLQDVTLSPNASVDEVVDTLMLHGMTVLPNVLEMGTHYTHQKNKVAKGLITKLRKYILKRNLELSDDEAIPLDGAKNRWSFGIHANEDPSVAKVLEHIGNNQMLKASLESLLGEDPAVAEITSITVAPGADAQGWHADVKPFGSSVKYAGTFTHSYSIFLPLQDVTSAMGATEVCPGTHYCADDDLWDVCVNRGFQAAKDGTVWKSGDGLIMNQKMWHRGSAYEFGNGDGPYRVVFIVTFISRPNPGVDNRQLAHGTYFHVHGSMYGHTFKDLKNASVSMAYPFSLLRSMGVWKPPNANWGWDWASVASLRISNSENGYHYDDLEDFVDYHPLATLLPSFLHGSVTHYGGWEVYFFETIKNVKIFVLMAYAVFFVAVFSLTLFLNVVQGGKRNLLRSFFFRVVFIHIMITFFGCLAWSRIQKTQFAMSVDSDTILAQPFLPEPKAGKGSTTSILDHAVSEELGPTTFPRRDDILFGKRHDSKHIGFYLNFLNYHPGNMSWREILEINHELYHSYSKLPSVFQNQIVSFLEREVKRSGRMLRQDDYGYWTILSEADIKKEVRKGLRIGTETLLSCLDKEVAILAASVRDGRFMRPYNAMKKVSKKRIQDLGRKLVDPILAQSNRKRNQRTKNFKIITSTPQIPSKAENVSKRQPLRQPNFDTNNFMLDDIVYANYRGVDYWMPARLIYKEYRNYGIVEFFYGYGRYAHGGGERSSVVISKLRQYEGLKEGDKVALVQNDCNRCPMSFLHGTILKMHPDQTCEVAFESGEIEAGLRTDDLALRAE